MENRRKHKRLPIRIMLAINELFRQDNEIIDHLNVEAFVTNISKAGIGFESQSIIPISFYFDARIDFNEQEFFYCVLKIIRIEEHEDYYIYGCEFVGLAEFLADKVDAYEESLENHH